MTGYGGIADAALSYGDSSAYPAIGFNPAPGTAPTIAGLAQNFTTVAGHLGQAHDAMTKAGQAGGFWEGDAAANFHKSIGELPDYLDKAHRSFGDAGKALAGWHDDLTSLQRTAQDYERQAAQAKKAVEAANNNPDLGLANRQFPQGPELDAANSKLQAANDSIKRANDELQAIRDQAARLFKQHSDLIHDVEQALKNAKDIAPDKPGLFDRIGDALGKVVDGIKDIADKTWKWVQDHADVIAKIGDVLSTVGTVLSVVAVATAWIPGVDAVTAAAAVGVSAAALGTHALAKAAGANVSWSTMAFDAVGAIPGGGAAKGALGSAKVLPKALKAGRQASKFAEEGGKLAAGTKAIGKTFSRQGAQAVGSRANMINKGIGGMNKVLTKVPGVENGMSKVAVNSFEAGDKLIGSGAKMAHTAQSGAAVAAGTGMLAAEKGAMQVGKWEAQPYIDDAKDSAKDTFNNVVGRR